MKVRTITASANLLRSYNVKHVMKITVYLTHIQTNKNSLHICEMFVYTMENTTAKWNPDAVI